MRRISIALGCAVTTALVGFVIAFGGPAASSKGSGVKDRATLAASRNMERSFFAKGVGRIIWEAWTTGKPTGNGLAARCPRTNSNLTRNECSTP